MLLGDFLADCLEENVSKSISAWPFFVTFLGWLSDPFKGYISDLQGDEKVTTEKPPSHQGQIGF